MSGIIENLLRIKTTEMLHEKLEELECSCDRRAECIQALAAPGSIEPRPQEKGDDKKYLEALLAHLKLYDAFWNASCSDFEASAAAIHEQRQPNDDRARYLVGCSLCLGARHLWRKGDLAQAETWALLASSQADRLPDCSPLKAKAHIALALVKTARCDWSGADGLIRRAEARGPGDPRNLAAIHEAFGRLAFEKGDFAEARRHLALGLDLSQQCHDDYAQVEVQLLRAHLYYHSSEYARHDRLLREADRHCRDLGYRRGQGIIARYRGKMHLHKNDELKESGKAKLAKEEHQKALNSFKESLRIFEEAGDTADAARSHLSLARGYAVGCQWDVARAEYDLAEKTFAKVKDIVRRATCQITKALLLARQAEKDRKAPADAVGEAKRLFRRAAASFRKQGDRRHLASALFEMGEQYSKWKDYGAAARCLKEAIHWASDMQAERLAERYQSKERLAVSSAEWAKTLLEAKRDRKKAHLVLNSVSHDLGNMVESVIGFADLALKMAHSPCPNQEILQTLTSRGRYLESVCKGMCDSAKAGGGKMALERQTVQLSRCVSEALEIVSPLSHCQTVELTGKVSEEIKVWADEQHLKRVLVNLIGNADKYTTEETIKVTADEDEHEVTITVADTGSGIARAKQKKVFDLFWQARDYEERQTNANAPGTGGFGIGLAYCALAVKSHGGRIWVDRDRTCQKGEDPAHPERHGTVIHFSLPKSVETDGASSRPS